MINFNKVNKNQKKYKKRNTNLLVEITKRHLKLCK